MKRLFALLAAAGGVWWLARQNRRTAMLEQQLLELENLEHQREADRALLAGILTHELRSPIAAVLGYQELLADGVLGPLDPRARDAVDRIARATRQLRTLADGIDAISADGAFASDQEDIERADPADILRTSIADATPDALLRGTRIDLHCNTTVPLITSPARVQRILELVFHASFKTSSGPLQAAVHSEDDCAVFEIHGAAIPPHATATLADSAAVRDGTTLRLLMAHRMAQTLGGSTTVAHAAGASVIRVVIPARIDEGIVAG
jgi:hypothetical protein